MKENSKQGEKNMDEILNLLEWEFREEDENPRFEGDTPWPLWEPFGFPAAPQDRPFITSNFVADKNLLVVGKDVLVEQLLGKLSFLEKQPLKPDAGALVDFPMMRFIRALSDGVMWGANTLTLQPHDYPDLLENRGRTFSRLSSQLHEFRERHALPDLPPLILVTSRGSVQFTARAFRASKLKVVILTSEAGRAKLEPEMANVGVSNTKILAFGQNELDLLAGLKHLRTQEGMEVVLCEGGHGLLTSLHDQGLLDEAFVTVSNKNLAVTPANEPKYMFDFSHQGWDLIAKGKAGQFIFNRWRRLNA